MLYIAGEDIKAGDCVVCCTIDGKLHPVPCTAGHYVGDAAENLREGFRCAVDDAGNVREDDA